MNNFVKPGPSTTQKPPQFLRGDSFTMPGSLFLNGNLLAGSPVASRDNRLAAQFEGDVFANSPHSAPLVETQSAEAAYDLVPREVGTSLPKRDQTDARIIANVRNGTGRIIRYESELGEWPVYADGPAPLDSDNDGIPDDWEQAHGINPNDSTDGNRIAADGYSNLEHYLNSLVPARGN